MNTNEVKITLTANDAATPAFKQAGKAGDDLKTNWLALTAKAAGVTAAFYSIKSAVDSYRDALKAAASAANDIERSAGVIGMTTDQYQKLLYVAKMADVANQEMAIGLKLLSRNMEDASRGSGEAGKWFTAMGISVKGASGELRPLDAVMGDIADHFAGWQDGPRKIAIALDLFGRSGEQLIPLLNQGKAGFQALGQEADNLGTILSPDLVKKGSAVEAEFKKMDATLGALKTSFLLMIAPVGNFADKIGDAAKKIIDFYSNPMVQTAMRFIMGITPGLQLLQIPSLISGPGEIPPYEAGPYFPGAKKKQPPVAPDTAGIKAAADLEQKMAEDNAKAWGDYAQIGLDALEKMQIGIVEAQKKANAEEQKLTDDGLASMLAAIDAEIGAEENKYIRLAEMQRTANDQTKAEEERLTAEGLASTLAAIDEEYAARYKLYTDIANLQREKNAEEKARLQETNDFWVGTATNMGQALTSGFFNLFHDGLTNAGDAFKKFGENMLNTFTNVVQQMITNWLMFGSIMGSAGFAKGQGFGGLLGLLFPSMVKAAQGGYFPGGFTPIQAFAGGGYVDRPTLGLVGEGGEGEFIIPKSKMGGMGGRQTIIYNDYSTKISRVDASDPYSFQKKVDQAVWKSRRLRGPNK